MQNKYNSHNKRCGECAKKITWIGLWDSVALAVFKGTIGLMTHSRALVGSALYSIHDVISGVALLVGLKVSDKDRDDEHPYGHGNVEFIVSVFTSLLILAGTLYILLESIHTIVSKEHHEPHWAAFAAAIISVCANEIIYRYNICAVKHLNSPAILAHARHHRADAIASLAVVIAILAGKMGYYYMDAAVAVFEAGHLLLLSIEMMYQSSVGLLDRSLNPELLNSMQNIISRIPGVTEVKSVKARQIGREYWLDITLTLADEIILYKAEKINKLVKEILAKKIKYLGNVHIIYA